MINALTDLRRPFAALSRVPFYYGWVMMGAAALAMVGTLPGRTQGLGLVTESLLKDLHLDRLGFAQMNLWATLLGSLFCLGIGRLVDQLGSRVVLTLVSLALGGVVLTMSGTSSVMLMFLLLVFSRGLGQSALSVVSLTMVGQWFKRRLSLAMGMYSVLLSIGFMAAFPLVGSAVLAHGWRNAWAGMAWCWWLGWPRSGLLWVLRGPETCVCSWKATPLLKKRAPLRTSRGRKLYGRLRSGSSRSRVPLTIWSLPASASSTNPSSPSADSRPAFIIAAS